MELCCGIGTAQLEEIKDAAKEFMMQFGKEYLKMYGLAMFERIKDDMEGGDDDRKLKYRDWKSIERPDVFTGECFMRSGEGPGAFGGWKKVFLVERKDYNLAVYPDEKAYIAKKRPKSVIRTAGYSLVMETSSHYKNEMSDIARGLGLSDAETSALATFSPYSWALAHPWRPNYMFQLHKGKGGGACACFGGGSAVEPEDAGAEFADKREEYLKAFERCTAYGNPRDLQSVTGKGFDLTVSKMKSKFDNLSDFDDEGFEAEILVDMLLQECLTPMRDDMLHDTKGPVSIRLMMWYKTRGIVQKALQGVSDPVWNTTQKSAQALGEKIEPQVRKGVEPILKVKEDVKQKIREKVIDKMGEFLKKYVTPYIDPILKAFDKPMTKGFEYAKDIFRQKVDIGSLSDDKQQRNLYLDEIPRTYSNTADLSRAADELVEPLFGIKRMSDEIFADMDPVELKNMAEMSLLTTLDAAIYTLECNIDEKGKSGDLITEILQDYDNDVIVARAEFVKEVVRGLVIMAFRKAIGPVADPVIESLDGFIPEDVQDFVSVAAIFEEIVDMFVGEPIDKMVEGAYPKPKK